MPPLTAEIRIDGLEELDAMLRALPEEVAGPIMQDALTQAGGVLRDAARGFIRPRSGKTAADLQVQVQVHPESASGAAGIGGTTKGPGARAWILRLLEFGARGKKHGGKGWDITGGATDRALARRATKALRATKGAAAAAALRASIRTGDVTLRSNLKLPGGLFRHRVHHPGFAPQSPLTRALAESGERSIQVFARVLRDDLYAAVDRLRTGAR
jgi:hypothetical protein